MCGQELTPVREEDSYHDDEDVENLQSQNSRRPLKDEERDFLNSYGSYTDDKSTTIDLKSANSGAIYNFLKNNNPQEEEDDYPITNPPETDSDEFNFDEQPAAPEVSEVTDYFTTEAKPNELSEPKVVVEPKKTEAYSSSIDRLRNKKNKHSKHNSDQLNKDRVESTTIKETTDNIKTEVIMQNNNKSQGSNLIKSSSQQLIGWLISFKKERTGSAVEIREGRFFIGGSKVRESDLIIADGSLSIPHCLMKADKESGIQVQDLMSENGTYIKKSGSGNFEKVLVPTVAEHGDWLKFGEYEVMVCIVPSEGRYM
jgi:hypothetical protein